MKLAPENWAVTQTPPGAKRSRETRRNREKHDDTCYRNDAGHLKAPDAPGGVLAKGDGHCASLHPPFEVPLRQSWPQQGALTYKPVWELGQRPALPRGAPRIHQTLDSARCGGLRPQPHHLPSSRADLAKCSASASVSQEQSRSTAGGVLSPGSDTGSG